MACFEVVENLSTPWVVFGSCLEIFSNLQKSSEIFGDLEKSFENFGNLQKVLINLRKFKFCGDENLTHFTEKKLAGITMRPLQLLTLYLIFDFCCCLLLVKNFLIQPKERGQIADYHFSLLNLTYHHLTIIANIKHIV